MAKITDTQMLSVEYLTGGYRNFRVKDISFQLNNGDFAGVIGPNGSGKSTLLKLILGDIKKSDGCIVLDGNDLSKMTILEKARNIAVVTQHIEPSGDMTVLEYILLGRLPYREKFQFFDRKHDIQLAEKYMALTGIERYKKNLLSMLSGGERQMVAMARALTQEPKLLLLDEPTSQLDINHQLHILDLVSHLKDELNLTILMIIHDLNLASAYCNKLIMISEGKVFAQGQPEDVIQDEIIREVYHTSVVTRPNPVTGKPTVFLVPDN